MKVRAAPARSNAASRVGARGPQSQRSSTMGRFKASAAKYHRSDRGASTIIDRSPMERTTPRIQDFDFGGARANQEGKSNLNFQGKTPEGFVTLDMRKLGRSSSSGIYATVFGSTGFTGRYVVSRLGRIGAQVIVPFRGEDWSWKHLKVQGDLGQVVPVRMNIRDKDSIIKSLQHSNIVINLIGANRATRNFSLEEANAESAKRIAEAAKEVGIKRFIHVSTANSDNPSEWARTKRLGEQYVKSILPSATILRPTDIYGAEDRFLMKFGAAVRRFPVIPVLENADREVQPLGVSDFVSSVVHALMNPAFTMGKTYVIGGPQTYTTREVIDYIKKETRYEDRITLPVPFTLSQLALRLGQYTRTQWYSKDYNLFAQHDNIVTPREVRESGGNDIFSLGVEPRTLESQAPMLLRVFRKPVFLMNEGTDESFEPKLPGTF